MYTRRPLATHRMSTVKARDGVKIIWVDRSDKQRSILLIAGSRALNDIRSGSENAGVIKIGDHTGVVAGMGGCPRLLGHFFVGEKREAEVVPRSRSL